MLLDQPGKAAGRENAEFANHTSPLDSMKRNSVFVHIAVAC